MTISAVSQALGRELYELERRRGTRRQISEEFPELTAGEAYAAQMAYADLRSGDGGRVVGRKIGLTSRAMQGLFGISTPDYGHIFDDMVVADEGVVDLDELIQPMVEIEIAFWMSGELKGPGVTSEQVFAATEAVSASIEIIDSRIEDWAITFIDTVADNGSSARCVLGEDRVDPHDLDLNAVVGELWRNGELVGAAPGSAVLDDPAAAVAWLANAIGEFGSSIRPGEFVLSGALMRAVPAAKGDRFEARFDGLGVASCRFA